MYIHLRMILRNCLCMSERERDIEVMQKRQRGQQRLWWQDELRSFNLLYFVCDNPHTLSISFPLALSNILRVSEWACVCVCAKISSVKTKHVQRPFVWYIHNQVAYNTHIDNNKYDPSQSSPFLFTLQFLVYHFLLTPFSMWALLSHSRLSIFSPARRLFSHRIYWTESLHTWIV